ncbi:Predicted integral membrane protein [Gracilibacillus orientalis]|uniref:Predicted integral membrane protein n=1 Tax=Gracilibacillus orientalis TaxID=334253 RepID=A0A1I4IRJ7_9BACI|nr:DUF2269 family protein [Gracilibacillus orientalis]SFL56471.1 Predicted integral membrane protein [Gracilibacillus orientalis]
MQLIYTWLVIIHIFSAIVGIGPGFVLTTIVKSAKSLPEIRHAFALKAKVHIYVMIGGILVLLTGLLMGAINPILFQQGWYLSSLVLYFIALSLGPTLLKKFMAPIKELIADSSLETIPAAYHENVQKLLRVEYIENTLLLIIILLMITKPF